LQYLSYILNNIVAKSSASTPPAPAEIDKIALFLSYFPDKKIFVSCFSISFSNFLIFSLISFSKPDSPFSFSIKNANSLISFNSFSR